ncbi:MAG: caspase family protein [Desulfobacteraceae bacterium]|nr:caspase family protein [Desulfobacteraceae bacterium]
MIIVVIIYFFIGCAVYKVGQESYSSSEQALKRTADILAQIVSGITVTEAPVHCNALMVLPTLDHIESHGIKFAGPRDFMTIPLIEYLKKFQMMNREFMFKGIKKRKIFDSIELVHNTTADLTNFDAYDFLIYLNNPSPDIQDWYIKGKNSPVPRPLPLDMEKLAGVPRTIAWLVSIEEIVRADQKMHTSSIQPDRIISTSYKPLSSVGQKWAIVVGIAQYEYSGKSGLTTLIFADDDAKAFTRTLQNLGWSDSHIKLLVNEEATQRNILIALESWLTKAGPNDQIVLFWAGHGFPDPEDPEKVYFACYDTDIKLPATGYRMDRVRSILEERKAKNVIVLADTCHAGKIITRGDRGLSIVPNIEKMSREQKVPKGWIFMVGADTDRQAIEDTSWANGAFTHSLIKGLSGKADGFQSAGAKDGIVTMGELRSYMNTAMPDETQRVLGVAKRPVITTSTGDPDIWNMTLQAK